MHERTLLEKQLKIEAERLSKQHVAPVVIIVGGTQENRITQTASFFPGETARLRDLLGLLEASIQIESLKHLMDREGVKFPFEGEAKKK
jgi:hypothetical protein